MNVIEHIDTQEIQPRHQPRDIKSIQHTTQGDINVYLHIYIYIYIHIVSCSELLVFCAKGIGGAHAMHTVLHCTPCGNYVLRTNTL